MLHRKTELLIQATEKFSSVIAMDLGRDECKMNSGQVYRHSYRMQSGEIIDPLSAN